MRETVTISTDAGFSPSNRIKSMTAINGAEEKTCCNIVVSWCLMVTDYSTNRKMSKWKKSPDFSSCHAAIIREIGVFFLSFVALHLFWFWYILLNGSMFLKPLGCSSFQLGRCMLTHPVQWPHWIDWSLKRMQRTPKDLKKKERIVFHSSMSKLCRLQ